MSRWCRLSSSSPPPSRRLQHRPVLLDQELQRLLVGEHHVRVQAEVVVARGVLAAEIPDEDDRFEADQ